MLILLSIVFSGCQEIDNTHVANNEPDSKTPLNTTLSHGTKVYGDLDKIRIINFEIVTEVGNCSFCEPHIIGDGFCPEKLSDDNYSNSGGKYVHYRISGTVKNIAGRMINTTTISADFYDADDIYLGSQFGTKIDNLPATYSQNFSFYYSSTYQKYFYFVDHITLTIETS